MGQHKQPRIVPSACGREVSPARGAISVLITPPSPSVHRPVLELNDSAHESKSPSSGTAEQRVKLLSWMTSEPEMARIAPPPRTITSRLASASRGRRCESNTCTSYSSTLDDWQEGPTKAQQTAREDQTRALSKDGRLHVSAACVNDCAHLCRNRPAIRVSYGGEQETIKIA